MGSSGSTYIRFPRRARGSDFRSRWLGPAREGHTDTEPTTSSRGLSSLRNQLLGFAKDGFLLRITSARNGFVDGKPFDTIHFGIVLGRIPAAELQKIERHDLENARGRALPFGQVGVLDGIDFS